jgi:hypothetical protein
MRPDKPIGDRVRELLAQKRPLTYEEVLDTVLSEYPNARTSKKSLQWYASRMRSENRRVTVKVGVRPRS